MKEKQAEIPAGPGRKQGERAGVFCPVNRPRIGPVPLLRRRRVVRGFVSLFIFLFSIQAHAADTVKIGNLFAYKDLPSYAVPYKKGWELAVEEINAAGGLLGHPVEVISRDDHGPDAAAAVRVAEELIDRDGVHILTGTMFGNTNLAVSQLAGQRKIPFMRWASAYPEAHKPENPYSFIVMNIFANAYGAAKEVCKQDVPRDWVSLAPNYVYGQSSVAFFWDVLKSCRDDVTWLDQQWPAVGKLDAGVTVGALKHKDPEAVLNVVFGSDLAGFIREGRQREFFEDRLTVSLEMIPENLRPIGAEMPEEWIITGYPSAAIEDPAHRAFVEKYRAKHGIDPDWSSLMGYLEFRFAFAAIEKAGSTDPEKIRDALPGLSIDSPVGSLTISPENHISNFGTWVGRSAVVDGVPQIVDWTYYDAGSMYEGLHLEAQE